MDTSLSRVGFTGTVRGMSSSQLGQFRQLVLWLTTNQYQTLWHGGARGADAQADIIAIDEKWKTKVIRPAYPGAKYLLARNRLIIEKAQLLIAAPYQNKEVLRSGTWATVRYARQAHLPIIMLTR